MLLGPRAESVRTMASAGVRHSVPSAWVPGAALNVPCLTREEEGLIMKPFARAFYRAARVQQDAGLLSPKEASAFLKDLFYNDAIAWVLMLTLFLTCLLPALLEMQRPPPEATDAEAALYILGTCFMFVSFMFGTCAVQGCVTACIQIKATPDAAFVRFLLHKWGEQSPAEWWHSFFYQKEASLFFMSLAILVRAIASFGLPALVIGAMGGFMAQDVMEKMYVLNFYFTNRAVEDLMRFQLAAAGSEEASRAFFKAGEFEGVYYGASSMPDSKTTSGCCMNPLFIAAAFARCLAARNMPPLSEVAYTKYMV